MNESVKNKKPEYSQERSTRWLSWIAKNMQQHDQTVFLIEDLQTTWLSGKYERTIHRISFVIIFSIIGLICGTLSNFFPVLNNPAKFGIVSGLIFGFVIGFMISTRKNGSTIYTIKQTLWSWNKLNGDYKSAAEIGFKLGSLLTLLFGCTIALIQEETNWDNVFLFTLTNGIGASVVAMFISGWDMTLPQTTTKPNEGISSTIRNSKKWLILGSIIGLLMGLYISLIIFIFIDTSNYPSWNSDPLSGTLQFMIIYGFIGAIIGNIWFGGKSVIQHFTLRLLIYIRGYGPWDFADFLDYAVDELHFMRRVGGGYIFIHRYLLEHFADIEKKKH